MRNFSHLHVNRDCGLTTQYAGDHTPNTLSQAVSQHPTGVYVTADDPTHLNQIFGKGSYTWYHRAVDALLRRPHTIKVKKESELIRSSTTLGLSAALLVPYYEIISYMESNLFNPSNTIDNMNRNGIPEPFNYIMAGIIYATPIFIACTLPTQIKDLKIAIESKRDESVSQKQQPVANMEIKPPEEKAQQGEIIGWGPQQHVGGNTFILEPIRSPPIK